MIIVLFLAACAFAFAVYAKVTKEPERILYVYLAVWLFFPKYIRKLPMLGDLPWENHAIFEILDAIGAFGVLVAIISNPRPSASPTLRKLKRFLVLFAVTACTSFALSFLLASVWPAFTAADNVPIRYRVVPFLQIVCGVVFAWGCIQFVRTLRQFETLLVLVVWSGIELTVEAICIFFLGWAETLRPWVVNEKRFQSIAFLSFDAVGVVSVLAICSAMYFVAKHEKYRFLPGVLLLLVPVLATYERGPLLASATALGCMCWFLLDRSWRLVGATAMVAVAVFSVLSPQIGVVAATVSTALGGEVRSDYSETTTFRFRMGLILRAMDVIVAEFPFGTGPDMVPYYMGSSLIPSIMPQPADPMVQRAYEMQTVNGELATNTHNIYVEFCAEHGLPGIVTMAALLVLIGGNFRRWQSNRRTTQGTAIYKAQACIYAAFAGLAVRYYVESGAKLYILLLMFVFFTSLLRELERRKTVMARPTVLVVPGRALSLLPARLRTS